ncbi:MAG TPA: AbrB/MazE/SpoVT family DNA-binding domain-containing protein [Thermoanaerobaculia bacterium]
MQTTISTRWQTVIPRKIRQELAIEPNSKLEWELKDGFVQVRPIPADPVKASLGLLRGRGLTTEDLLAERRRERARERQRGHG